MGIANDRWTCPDCDRTFVLDSPDLDRSRLSALQGEHAAVHAVEERTSTPADRSGSTDSGQSPYGDGPGAARSLTGDAAHGRGRGGETVSRDRRSS